MHGKTKAPTEGGQQEAARPLEGSTQSQLKPTAVFEDFQAVQVKDAESADLNIGTVEQPGKMR